MLAAKQPTGEIVVWCLILMGLVGLLGVGIWMIRRRLFTTPASTAGDEWSLQQLRELKSRGEISDGEFERLRSNIIAQYKSATERRAKSARGVTGEIGEEPESDSGENSSVD